MVTGTGIWAFISPRRGVSGAHFGGLRILRTLCRMAARGEPGRPEFKARRFHTPVENAIYLLGTSATRPQCARGMDCLGAAWSRECGARCVLSRGQNMFQGAAHAQRRPVLGLSDPSLQRLSPVSNQRQATSSCARKRQLHRLHARLYFQAEGVRLGRLYANLTPI